MDYYSVIKRNETLIHAPILNPEKHANGNKPDVPAKKTKIVLFHFRDRKHDLSYLRLWVGGIESYCLVGLNFCFG